MWHFELPTVLMVHPVGLLSKVSMFDCLYQCHYLRLQDKNECIH